MAIRKRTTAPARKGKDADTPAYFLSLTVENARCFGPAQTLDLSDGNDRPRQWTIILGDNGVGKTTLLRSLVAVVPIESSFNLSDEGQMKAPMFGELLDPFMWKPSRGHAPDSHATFTGAFFTDAKLTDDSNGRTFKDFKLDMYIGGVTCDISEPGKIGDLVYFGYGATRIVSDTSLSKSVEASPASSLFSDNAPLLNAEEWLLQADYAASKASTVQQSAKRRRDHIREVLLKLLPDIDEIRFGKLSENQLNPSVEFNTPYGWVRLQDLSLGYKTLIAWMVDFASRMFDRYPDSPNPLAEPAVCLVDEIDLHLHPTWQRKLIGYLTDLFPNTQFIVTAHSPLVVQAATDANIVVLRREGDHVVIDNSIESLKGWSVDQILTSDLYGVASERPPEYDDVLAERQRLLSKPELTTGDKRRLRTLEAKIEELPIGETPQDIAAFDLVRRFAADLERRGVTTETFAGDEKTEAKQNTKRAPRARQAAGAKQKSSKKSAKR